MADARVRLVTDKSAEALGLTRHSTAHLMAAAVTALFPGAQCGIGPAIDEGFFYDFVVSRPFVPEDLEAIEAEDARAGRGGPAVRAADVAARGGARLLRPARRAAEGPADRGEDGRPVARLGLHDQGPRHVRRFLRRTARALVGQAEGVQAALDVERLLEGRRAQRADAAHLRHGVPARQGPEGVPDADRAGQEARPPQGRARDGPVHVPSVGAGRGVLARQGHDALQHARQLHARRAVSGRLRRGEDAAHLQQGALGDLGTLAALPPEHVPGRVRVRADGASRR